MMYERPLRPDELMHFGVKGMKWGVRRYQNKDGSLTPLGKKKYGSKENFEYQRQVKRAKRAGYLGIAAGTAGAAATAYGVAQAVKENNGPVTLKQAEREAKMEKLLARNTKQGKGKDNISDLEVISKQTSTIADNTYNMAARASDIQKRRMAELKDPAITKEMSTMSNKDLQDYITRQNLERQYRSLRQPEIRTGLDTFQDIMAVVGPLTTTAAAAVTIGATIYKIKHPS